MVIAAVQMRAAGAWFYSGDKIKWKNVFKRDCWGKMNKIRQLNGYGREGA